MILSWFLLLAAFLLAAQGASAQSPIVPAPMAPIAQWPAATPTAPPTVPPNQALANQALGATTPPQPAVNTSPTPAQVMGIGNFTLTESVWSVPGNQESLGDAAREARRRLAQDHPRVITNEDIARLRRASGELPTAPATGPVTNEQTMPASDIPNPNANGPQKNGRQNNLPASDQTTPPTNMNQNPEKRSPFEPKK